MGTQLSPRRSRLDTIALFVDRWLGAVGTGLGRLGRRLFLRVGPPRAVLDGLVVNALALLVIWLLDPRPATQDPGWLSYPLILDLSLVSALRLRLPPGASWRQNLRNSLLCQVLLLPFCVAWAFVVMSQGQPYESLFGVLDLGTPLWQTIPVVLLEIV